MRFIISSGTDLRQVVDRREGAGDARDLVKTLLRHKRPNVRIRDNEGRFFSLMALERLAAQEKPAQRH
ncbi:MAG: hypothetical protein E7774_07000 [Bradyrhizobium sp.]|nr:MAG: hypothetical protein E7774_07000 [Bradyrhizobium sp.]